MHTPLSNQPCPAEVLTVTLFRLSWFNLALIFIIFRFDVNKHVMTKWGQSKGELTIKTSVWSMSYNGDNKIHIDKVSYVVVADTSNWNNDNLFIALLEHGGDAVTANE